MPPQEGRSSAFTAAVETAAAVFKTDVAGGAAMGAKWSSSSGGRHHSEDLLLLYDLLLYDLPRFVQKGVLEE